MDLLEVAKLEDNKLEVKKEGLKGDELKASLAWVMNLAQREEKTVALNIEEEIMLKTDKNLLTRVLENLLSNGLKHTPKKGTITLNVRPDGSQMLFEVIDSGEGIPKEYLDKVFEKFFKVESQTMKTKLDTGLGLTFCKLAVEGMGGKIAVESEVGKGSRFFFRLPLG